MDEIQEPSIKKVLGFLLTFNQETIPKYVNLKAAKSTSKPEVAPTEATQRTSQGVNREINARDMGKHLTTVICESPSGRLCNMDVDMSPQRNTDENSVFEDDDIAARRMYDELIKGKEVYEE